MSKSIWLLSAGLFGLAVPAHAQDAPPAAGGQTAPTQEASDANADDANGGEIVVTATRRNALLSDVPLAVSAVTAETLENTGANDIRQLNQVAPSLLVSSTGSEANGSARIRGVGTVGDNPGLESSVAVFIDGVYRSRSGIGLNELGEIDRVEVLRGPQGTLFGRNASAGLIHIISKKPSFTFGGNAELTYGNYDYLRAAASITGPLSETIAARLDGVWAQRDGFYHDVNNNTDVNDRDRYFVRGQLLFEPSDAISFRLIADYTHRDEKCCGAVYLNNSVNPLIGNLNEPASPILVGGVVNPNGNNIINVLRDLGQPLSAYADPYSRNIYVTPGRSYQGITKDGGISGELNWKFGNTTFTSITAYRDYDSDQGSDTDYSQVDILYRAADGGAARKFKTFSEELRLQGTAFNDKLDWLVGAYFADESLTVTDNLRFGSQYGRFATCRVVSGSALAALYSPTSAGCLAARPALFGAASPIIYAAFDRLDSINDKGSTLDVYKQNSRNYAIFTHNIFHITDKLDLTLGIRYTNERKKLNTTFGNDNTACLAQQQALVPFLSVPALAATAGGLIGLACQGNSTSELNGVNIRDKKSEDEFTGTANLAFKPTDDLLLYASYSRGYKAGGFNLDRSALKSPILPFALTPGGAQALVGNLRFDPEINNAYELGAKYSRGPISVNLAIFRQDFQNFQLNTFNGTVFLVQTINGCGDNLNGGDRDLSAATGACPAKAVGWGVRSEGIELEGSFRPARHLGVNLGLTWAGTKYRDQLVGNSSGVPLDPALRKLPGDNLSNAPAMVATGSLTWTPPIGGTGLSGLFYIDARTTADYNTGSDLFPQKEQDGYTLVNARIGVRGANERWALELWAQNLFDVNYAQVAFNSPFQAGATSAPFVDPQFPGGRQIFSAYLAEPRTYGVTARFKF
jgi:iron complex outermembrane receptor protein